MIMETFNVARFVYSASAANPALPDGDYTITNINGTGGLVPYVTYLGNTVQNSEPPFMNDDVIGYTLHVDAAKQFDFLNFMAYVVPVGGVGMVS